MARQREMAQINWKIVSQFEREEGEAIRVRMHRNASRNRGRIVGLMQMTSRLPAESRNICRLLLPHDCVAV